MKGRDVSTIHVMPEFNAIAIAVKIDIRANNSRFGIKEHTTCFYVYIVACKMKPVQKS